MDGDSEQPDISGITSGTVKNIDFLIFLQEGPDCNLRKKEYITSNEKDNTGKTMKIIAINGSPRSRGNTAAALEAALRGAASTGADTEMIQLGELAFSGCRSCFSCKLKNGGSYAKCAVQDDLTPVLERVSHADGVILGTPIYFSAESGLYRNFIERLFFPFLRYSDPVSSAALQSLQMAFVYTMNVPADSAAFAQYREYLEKTHFFPKLIFNSSFVEALYIHDTFQFSDYSKYESDMFDPVHKAEVRKTQFPRDLNAAFELGKRLAENSGDLF